ncbi:MAG: sigma-70 family RNA polymerase sigma factor [Crocinitomicaceae bacterium]|nr:sigma-70 family RNA polymerase sigma factor [Crocinitomicaceae bacterium]
MGEIDNTLSEKGKKDLVLVEAAKKGDQVAYAKLMEKYRESIYFMMLKMVKNPDDAEDLTMEAFGKAFNRLKQYSPNYAFSTWLFKIASNNSIDFIRKKRVKLTSMDSAYENSDGETISMDVKCDELDPEEVAIKDQKTKLMRKVVDQLKPRYRDLIVKRYFEELSYDEIADEMKLPLGTVKAQLFRAREFLATIMETQKHTI